MLIEERWLIGGEYLAAVVDLLRRVRTSHRTAGVWEAADVEWWWRKPRMTDDAAQLFWFADDRPVATAIVTDWGDRVGLDVVTLPDASRSFIADVTGAGIERALQLAVGPVESLVDDADPMVGRILSEAGFVRQQVSGSSAWMAAADRPTLSDLAVGNRLVTRAERGGQPHHFVARNGPEVEERLRQTSMYRADLDLAVVDSAGEVVSYGLFWFDPITRVGLVEPMRTLDAHQRRGFARHVLTAGLSRLATLGAERLKINWENDNPAAAALYIDSGFEVDATTVQYLRPTSI